MHAPFGFKALTFSLIVVVSLAYQLIIACEPLRSPVALQERLQKFYYVFLYSLVAVVTLIAPALTASAISFERKRRTLDLLLITPLHQMQILAGKLIASWAFCPYCLLSQCQFPILSLDITMRSLPFHHGPQLSHLIIPVASLHPFAAPIIKSLPTEILGLKLPSWLFVELATSHFEPNVLLEKTNQIPQAASAKDKLERYDVVIFDGTNPQLVEANSIWLINVADGKFVQLLGNVNQPAVVAWEHEHPILRYVDLSPVLIDRTLKVRIAECAQAIAECRETPLIVVGEHDGKKWLFIGFNLSDSDFPSRTGFPIFIANALKWSVGKQQLEYGFIVKAGNIVSLTLPLKKATMRYPDGKTREIASTDHSFLIRDTNRVGIYQPIAGKFLAKFH